MTTIPLPKCVFCRWSDGNYLDSEEPWLFDGDKCGECGISAEEERVLWERRVS